MNERTWSWELGSLSPIVLGDCSYVSSSSSLTLWDAISASLAIMKLSCSASCSQFSPPKLFVPNFLLLHLLLQWAHLYSQCGILLCSLVEGLLQGLHLFRSLLHLKWFCVWFFCSPMVLFPIPRRFHWRLAGRDVLRLPRSCFVQWSEHSVVLGPSLLVFRWSFDCSWQC